MKHLLYLAVLPCFAAVVAEARCKPEELSLKFPMRGKENVEWVVNNYVDLDKSAGSMRDYRNNKGADAKTYDGHNGIDIDLPSFRSMDNGFNVFAAAAGTVTEVKQDLFDRNYVGPKSCGEWNHVAIDHGNGFIGYYGHLKKNSVRVKVGDVVPQGKALGLVGSSGCSSTAHLHFELQCDGTVVDPMENNMFSNPPVYDPPMTVMDMMLRKGEFPGDGNDALIKDPQPNVTSVNPNTRLAVGVSTAGGKVGDSLDIQILRNDNSLWTTFGPLKLTNEWRHGWPRWWATLPATGSGQWTARVRINGNEAARRTFTVESNLLNITYAMHDSAYQDNYNSLIRDQYRTLQIDGSTSPDGARLSAIHRRDGVGVTAFHNLNNAGFADLYKKQTAAGFQLLSIDSYVRNGELNVAGYFGPKRHSRWRVEHFLTRDAHQKVFDEVTKAGLVPYAISVAVLNGTHYYTSAYGAENSGPFMANADIPEATYQKFFNENTSKGMGLAYLDVYDNGQGVPLFSAIWKKSVVPSNHWVKHNVLEKDFIAFTDQQRSQGFQLTHITSYLKQGNRYFAGIWTK